MSFTCVDKRTTSAHAHSLAIAHVSHGSFACAQDTIKIRTDLARTSAGKAPLPEDGDEEGDADGEDGIKKSKKPGRCVNRDNDSLYISCITLNSSLL